jgi:hypothetical protein
MKEVAFLLLFSSPIFAGVSEGESAFRKGDFAQAAKEFAEAEQKSPDNLNIVFNHGAALAAAGKLDDATATLQRSATARNEGLAAKSLSLLGQIAVDKAKRSLAENPADTEPDKRKEVLEQLDSAERYYNESNGVQPSDTAKETVEQIRAWRNKTAAEWDEADRRKQRQGELFERLKGLGEHQESIRKETEQAASEPASPKTFQTCYENTKGQGNLSEEFGLLKDTLHKMPQQPATPNGADAEKALETAKKNLPLIQTLTEEAAKELSANQPTNALAKQDKALELLQEILKQQEQNQDKQQQNQDEQQKQNGQEEKEKQDKEEQEQQDEKETQEQKKQKPEKQEEKESADEKQEKEKAERMLRQVRRKQQEANERREKVKALLMELEPVEKDW